MTRLGLILVIFAFAGCETISTGKIVGDRVFHTYRDVTLSGPSTSAIVVTSLDGTEVLAVHAFAGESLLAELVPGAALVWAASELDTGDRNTNTNYTGASSNQSTTVDVVQNPMPMGGD